MVSVHSPEVGSVAGSGAVGVCSSGFSSAGVSFLGSGAGFFSVFVCVCVFVCGAADSGLAVGVPHAVASRSNGDDAGGCGGSGLGHGWLPSLVLFFQSSRSVVLGAFFSKKNLTYFMQSYLYITYI